MVFVEESWPLGSIATEVTYKLQKETSFKISESTFQSWVAGVAGGSCVEPSSGVMRGVSGGGGGDDMTASEVDFATTRPLEPQAQNP